MVVVFILKCSLSGYGQGSFDPRTKRLSCSRTVRNRSGAGRELELGAGKARHEAEFPLALRRYPPAAERLPQLCPANGRQDSDQVRRSLLLSACEMLTAFQDELKK